MYWTDFKRFIERNAQPAAKLYYRGAANRNQEQVLICDWDLPRRDGVIVMAAWSEHDWYLQTKVIDCAWVNGEVPLKDEKDRRGVLNTLMQLMLQGVLMWTDEMRDFLRANVEPRQYERFKNRARDCANKFGWGCPAVG